MSLSEVEIQRLASEVYGEDKPSFGEFQFGSHDLAGHGEVSNPETCGKFARFVGCLRTDLHRLRQLDGVDHSNHVDVHARHMSCFNPRCPLCYKSWAVREAKSAAYILGEASRLFGVVEHGTISVPPSMYGLKFETVKAKVMKGLRDRGVLGGIIMFHPARFNSFEEARKKQQPQGWYFSSHFHFLGFIEGGYGQCRKCDNLIYRFDEDGEQYSDGVYNTERCLGCSGFEGRTRRCNLGYVNSSGSSVKGDGFICKVMGERKTVVGSLYYQLNHAGVKHGSERGNVAFWFGVCARTKLKVKPEEREPEVCRICGHDLGPIDYVGVNGRLWFLKAATKPFFDDLLDSEGGPQWIKAPDVRRKPYTWKKGTPV